MLSTIHMLVHRNFGNNSARFHVLTSQLRNLKLRGVKCLFQSHIRGGGKWDYPKTMIMWFLPYHTAPICTRNSKCVLSWRPPALLPWALWEWVWRVNHSGAIPDLHDLVNTSSFPHHLILTSWARCPQASAGKKMPAPPLEEPCPSVITGYVAQSRCMLVMMTDK